MSVYLPAHQNQFRDPSGKPWPKSFGKDMNRLNCWAAMAAEGADAATRGALKLTPPQIRTESGDKSGGANRGDVARVLRAHGITALTPHGVTWGNVKDKLATGRWFVWLATDYEEVPDAKSCSPNFDGLHALLLFPVPLENGKVTASDPLCPSTKKYPEAVLRKAAEKCRDQAAASGLLVVYIKQIPEAKPPAPPPTDPKDRRIAELMAQVELLSEQADTREDQWTAYADAIVAVPRP